MPAVTRLPRWLILLAGTMEVEVVELKIGEAFFGVKVFYVAIGRGNR